MGRFRSKSARVSWAAWFGPWSGHHQGARPTLWPLGRGNQQTVVPGAAGRGEQADAAGPSPDSGGSVGYGGVRASPIDGRARLHKGLMSSKRVIELKIVVAG